MGEYSYSSVQINITGLLRQQLLRESMRIRSKDLYTAEPKYGRESNPHVTVKYGIHTKVPAKIEALLQGITSVEFELGEISLFQSNKDYDVVKISIIDTGALRRLNKVISGGTKCTDSFRTYNPHVTLAYVKKGAGKSYVGKSLVTGKTFKSNKIMFSGHNDKMTDIPLGKNAPKTITKAAGAWLSQF